MRLRTPRDHTQQRFALRDTGIRSFDVRSAGETRKYEDNVIDLLLENLQRLWRGETQLKNGFV